MKTKQVKKVPTLLVESTWQQLRDWHVANRTTELRSAFELGDLITNASITTGLKVERVILRLRSMLGELAYSNSTYRRAAHLVKTFSLQQRQVLIDRGVSLIRAQVLASAYYDGERRIRTLVEIKAGRLKSWVNIRRSGEANRPKKTAVLRHGIQHIDDVVGIQIRIKGEFQRDLMLDGLRSLLSQVPQPILIDELNVAVNTLRKLGKRIKPFRI